MQTSATNAHPIITFPSLPDAAKYLQNECKDKKKLTVNVKLEGFCLIKFKYRNDPEFNSAERLSKMTAASKQPYQGKLTLKQMDPDASKGDITYGMRVLKIFKEQLIGLGLPVDILKDASGKIPITGGTHGYRAVPRKQAQTPSQSTQAPAAPTGYGGSTFISAGIYTEIDESSGTVKTYSNIRKVT